MISQTGAPRRCTGMLYTVLPSPLGPLVAVGHDGALTHLHMGATAAPAGARRDDGAFARLALELGEYFAGKRRAFTVGLEPAGTPFERRVWGALAAIPYGATASYGEIARRLDSAGSARAVGLANSRNPIAILVPCHRVIGTDGSLTGYAGGLACKRALLDLEAGVSSLLV